MRTTFVCLAFSFAICCTGTGCLLSHSHRTVLRQTELLQPVTFESDESKSVYESAVSSAMSSGNSKASLAIPFLVGLERTKSVAENAVRNDVAQQFDMDGDLHITDAEAQHFRR